MSEERVSIESGGCLRGVLSVPGDKSISHRALLFAALAQGKSELRGLADGADVASTRTCLEQLGVSIAVTADKTSVEGVGLDGFKAPHEALDCGNSGTTMRLLMGILAGQNFETQLMGDQSLSARPMGRIAEPLKAMGAKIGLTQERFAPLHIQSSALNGFEYDLPVASAQVKSALLLAGLYANQPVILRGKLASRDHTERMLPAYGVALESSYDSLSIQPKQHLRAVDWQIPGDFSSAAFWLAGAALLPGSDLSIEGVSLNATRTGFARVLQAMGADLEIAKEQEAPEPIGKIRLRYAPLRGITLDRDEIPFLIDEIPLLMLLATQAKGRTVVHGAAELRVKESDRLAVMENNLKAMGAQVETFEDGFCIDGPQSLQGAVVQAHHDHRIAMTMALAALVAQGQETIIEGADAIAVSYPEFLDVLSQLRQTC